MSLLNLDPDREPSHEEEQKRLDEEVRRTLRRKSRRSFLIGGAAVLAGWGAYEWIDHASQVGQLQKPLRTVENANAVIGRAVFGNHRLAPTYSKSDATMLRLNGDAGLDPDLMLDSWRLQVVGLNRPERYPQFTPDVNLWDYRSTDDSDTDSDESSTPDIKEANPTRIVVSANPTSSPSKAPGILLTLAEIQKLPRIEMVTQFKCIEGWSQIVWWEGVRFSDFMRAYPPKLNPDGSLPKYVAMETTADDFYTGYDTESLLNPQTLLCYAMGGKPLTMGHGAPLRLSMPSKYGYKQIKQIAKIAYTNTKPPDYWAEQGYDWYGSL